MSRKMALFLFAVISIIGSLLCFSVGNFLFADIANYTYGWNGLNLFASIPGLLFAFDFVALAVLLIRYYIRPMYRKSTLLLYIRIIILFSAIGIISVFLSAKYSYYSIMSPYPFKYYLIICLIIHSILLIGLTILYIIIKRKMGDIIDKKKMSIGYIIYSICLPGYIFLAFNKFGALLLSPIYIQVSTLYMTWPVYVWLLTPILLLLFVILKDFKFFNGYNEEILYLVMYIVLNVSLAITFHISTSHNTLFISAVSPAYGLDRLATHPYVATYQFFITACVSLYYLIRCIIKKATHKKYGE